MREILVVAEYDRKDITGLTKEMLGVGRRFARETGASLTSLVLGAGYDHLTDALASYGAEVVYLGAHADFNHYNGELYLATVESLIRKQQPEFVLCGMTANGRDLGTRLAARLRTVFIAGCGDISWRGAGEAAVTRFRFDGFGQELVTLKNPQAVILGIPPDIQGIEKPAAASPRIVSIDRVCPSPLRVHHVDTYVSDPGEIDLAEADLVLAGGNGMGDQETFALLQQAADLMGGSLGGSRVAQDKGWIPPERMIGATGKVLRARVYLAWGIEGAVQHRMGIKDCQKVIAVNKNPRAEIIQAADLAVIGDVREILPAFVKQLGEYLPKREEGLVEHEREKAI
ncbi:electron transfer flavoprotein subunit alpha/FixB family protein [Candidatus Formimonas warabiya]|uniref:Electron transfer flavoprotein alpha/beta-subunit N-terminal domain-containing protein n=1 Tax=Formimonas warabiya TaxID=1761012 RepID=A0A3G1KR63_FORW1|nr:electron transfer flavoprotein subunit alpha/FixB family protein [Candidatus Formimonas warabiya]ATW24927.1 hypothetical protein DCMF_09215 [Candidatus Formimonas warabiya]